MAASRQQIITKKSSFDQVSSADLPAEFRDNDDAVAATNDGGNEAANEQSKLARLCQQTSSVLASVLPAPFGGHKRSILCQFFGQVPFSRKHPSQPRPAKQQLQFNEQQQLLLQQHQQVPQYETAESAVALIQSQYGQQPVAVLPGNRHPIEIVLEQQRRQHNQLLLANSRLAGNLQRAPANLPIESMQTDLKSSASVLDYAYQQRVEPPASMRHSKGALPVSKLDSPIWKFSKQITATSFRPVASTQATSRPMSTSGWRIFNQTSSESSSPMPPVSSTTEASSSSTGRANKQEDNQSSNVDGAQQQVSHTTKEASSHVGPSATVTKVAVKNQTDVAPRTRSDPVWSESLNIGSAQLLVMGKPPGFNQHHQSQGKQSNGSANFATASQDLPQVNIGKRSEALKPTTRSAETGKNDSGSSAEVRTIEVNAQNQPAVGGNSGRTLVGGSSTSENLAIGASSTQKPAADLRQVQKREELVIASINNLTRIAFGNQLRDTVKVINKLIDQHSDLFSANKKALKDPMLTFESGRQQQVLSSDSKLSVQAKKGYSDKSFEPKSDTSTSKEIGSKASAGSTVAVQASGESRQKQILLPIVDKTTARSAQSKPTKKPKRSSTMQPAAAAARTWQQSTMAYNKQTSFANGSTGFSSLKTTSSNAKQLAKEVSDPSKQSPFDRSTSGRHGERKSSASQPGDLQRLHGYTVSRALSFGGAGSSMMPSRTTEPFEQDLPIPAVTIDDIHRDKAPWRLANGQTSTTRAVPRSLPASSTTLAKRLDKKAQFERTTKFPWLLPDKSVYHSDMFGGLPSTTIEARKPLTGAEMLKKWTTRKAPVHMGVSGKQALVLNRLDNSKLETMKMDSLTTLKMSLTTASPSAWSSMQKTSGSTQSRWIPTSGATRASSGPSTTTSTTPLPTLAPTTVASSTTARSQPEEVAQTTVAAPTSTSTQARESLTQNDLNEARASDSISRYTTHWNEASDLLAASQKRVFQQPMPQIAQTGDYFSAETISNWPERYQTMLESSRPTTSAAFSETTRRDGEAYENQPFSTLLATRHRLPATMDALAQEASTRTTRSELVSTLTGVTILPANHKLTSTTQQMVEHQMGANTSRPSLAETTGTLFQTASSPAYTLVGALTSETASEPDASAEQHLQQPSSGENGLAEDTGKFPRIMDDVYTVAGSETAATAGLSGLKPPYLEQHDEEPLEIDGDSILTLYNQSTLSRPQVSRKLYEMLVPSTRSFVGPQSPLNQQRFNLSALKFLAQNLFTSPKNNYKGVNESLASQEVDEPRNGTKSISNHTSPQRLLDILGGASIPANYDELLLNTEENHPAVINKSGASTETGSSNKSLFGRASNLLNDLRQLEHKKAAALLAAIRYQVPSPLVRPWDLATDGHIVSELAGVRDRLDGAGRMTDLLNDQGQIRDGFLLSQLSTAIRSALFKQRLVPRSELEARLKRANGFNENAPLNANLSAELGYERASERRSDSSASYMKTLPESLSYSLGDSYNPMYNGSRHDEAPEEYLLAGYKSPTAKLNARNLLPSAKSWIDRLLLGSGASGSQNKSSAGSDYDLIDLSASTKTLPTDENEPVTATRYPKYIRLNDFKTTWSDQKAEEIKFQSLMPPKQQLPSAAVAARLRANLAHFKGPINNTNGTTDSQDEEVEIREAKTSDTRLGPVEEQAETKKELKFSCLDRQAGFYPDTASACQVSSTGSLCNPCKSITLN